MNTFFIMKFPNQKMTNVQLLIICSPYSLPLKRAIPFQSLGGHQTRERDIFWSQTDLEVNHISPLLDSNVILDKLLLNCWVQFSY